MIREAVSNTGAVGPRQVGTLALGLIMAVVGLLGIGGYLSWMGLVGFHFVMTPIALVIVYMIARDLA